MRDRLFINEQEVELLEDDVIAITSQINNLAELRDHQSNLTNSFKAPKSDNNRKILEQSDVVQSATAVPYRKNIAKIIKHGAEVVSKGFAVVESSDEFFNITVYSGNIDFFSIIEGKKLSDLDWSALNHVFDYTHIINSRTYTATQGYKYSLIDYGHLTNNVRRVNMSELRPCLFVKKVFEMIIEQAGFEFEGLIFDSDKFAKLLFTTDNSTSRNIYFDNLQRVTLKPWYTDPPLLPAAWDPTNILIRPYEVWNFSLRIVFDITGFGGSSFFKIYLNVIGAFGFVYTHSFGNGQFDQTITWTADNTSGTPVDHYDDIELNLKACTLDLKFGELTGTKVGSSEPDIFVHIPPVNRTANVLGMTGIFGIDMERQYGYSEMNLARVVDEMSQKDFIKAVANIFQLMFKTGVNEKKLYIKQFKEIVNSRPIAEDWSDKLHDQKGKHSVGYRIGNYCQTNNFRYTQDEDDKLTAAEFADSYLSIDDETLQPDIDLVQLPFAPSRMENALKNLPVPIINKYDATTDERTIDNVMRLLIDDTQSITGDDLEYYDDIGNSASHDTFIPLCYFFITEKDFNLKWGDSLLADSYEEFEMVINRAKKLVVLLRLTALDFKNHDHFIPKYFSQHSAYFYVNKLLNWTGNGLTKAEIIRIGRKEYSEKIVKIQRCIFQPEYDYGSINRSWPLGGHEFELLSLELNGIEYSNGEVLALSASGDLVIGLGIDGVTNFVMNISDWINTIIADNGVENWTFYDDLSAVDKPVGQTFRLLIHYTVAPIAGGQYYLYTETGWRHHAVLANVETALQQATYVCEILEEE